MSPATKTPSASVCQSGRASTAPRAVAGHPELVQQRLLLGAVEADRQQHQVGRQLPLGAGQRGDDRAGRRASPRSPRRSAPPAPGRCRRRRTPAPRRRRPARRPPRAPGSCAASTARSATGRAPSSRCVRRLRVEVELVHAGRALPVGHAEAVGGGVAAADDHHVLAGRVDRRAVGQRGPACRPPRPPGWRRPGASIAWCTPRSAAPRRLRGVPAGERAAGQQHRVVLGAQLLGGDVDADVARRCGTARPRRRAGPAAGRCAASPA